MKTHNFHSQLTLVCQIATENTAPRSLHDDNQHYLLVPPAALCSCLLPPGHEAHRNPEVLTTATKAGRGDALNSSKYDRLFGSSEPRLWAATLPPPSTKQLFHVVRFKWYLGTQTFSESPPQAHRDWWESCSGTMLQDHKQGCVTACCSSLWATKGLTQDWYTPPAWTRKQFGRDSLPP